MINITKIKVLSTNKTQFTFSDGREKTFDFTPFIGESEKCKPLSDPAYFEKVELYEHGRGIFWPNGYDYCPDFLYQYQPEKSGDPAGK
jgi:hypothetical protein